MFDCKKERLNVISGLKMFKYSVFLKKKAKCISKSREKTIVL